MDDPSDITRTTGAEEGRAGTTCRPFVSIIIPVFNDAQRLELCLQALERQSYPGNLYEVIVVDNGSDGAVAPKTGRSDRIIFSSETRRSSYAARNKGLALARGAIIAFTDSDCIPAYDWIERGVSRLLEDSGCGIIGGQIDLFFKNPDRPTVIELLDRMTYLNQRLYIANGRFAATANLFTLKSVFNRVGIFDGTLKSSGDVDWCRRVLASGLELLYADDVRVSHPARSSMRELYRRKIRVAGGMHDYALKNGFRWGCLFDTWGFRSSLCLLRDSRSAGWKRRLQMVAIHLSMEYIGKAENVRLWLGGGSRP